MLIVANSKAAKQTAKCSRRVEVAGLAKVTTDALMMRSGMRSDGLNWNNDERQ
jgi:hypothetical protein